jgi:GH15 family glucan-1,4-alpha-glucosidase
MPNRIEDYGLIGNSQNSALVSRAGSIDWLCAPHFDSDACVAALLGTDEHGRFSLRPAEGIRASRQRYREVCLVIALLAGQLALWGARAETSCRLT